MNEGMNDGMNEGMNDGMNEGMNDGMNEGMNEGKMKRVEGYDDRECVGPVRRYHHPTLDALRLEIRCCSDAIEFEDAVHAGLPPHRLSATTSYHR